MSEINASAVKKMKVTDLRSELTKRGLDTKGLKQVLVDRLLAALEDDQPVEMATEVKEEPEEEPTEVAENGQAVKTEPKEEIEEVAQQPPDELMAEDTTVPEEKNDEPAVKEEPIDETEPVDEQENKVDEPEAMESEEKDQEAVETENDKQDSIMQDAEEEKSEEQEEKSAEQEEKSGEQEEKSAEQEEKSTEQEEKSSEQEEKSEVEMPKKEKKRESLLEVEEEKDETEDSSVVLSRYVSDLYFKISPDGLKGSVITDEGFTYIWAGAKTTWGVNKGKVCYECKVLKNVENDLPDTEEPKNGVRVGWSVAGSGLQLGEEGLSYGFENTGKSCTASEFSEYGASYTQGDVIGCYLDLESEEATISYTKNGEDLGVAFTVPKEDLADKVLYPHIIVKNTECQINTGAQDDASFPFPTKEGYTLIQQMGNENLVEGPRGAKEKEDCEVLMMVGLPASGKTTWVNKHVGDEKEKNYNIIGTNSVMAKMKVNGEERKRSSENYDKLMEKATRCLRRIFELAPTKKRNYILDQTNVHPNAQKRKMESFSGFKRIAVVVCPKPEELDKRTKEKKEKKGFEVPEFALNDMKANFTLPRVGPLFTEVNFIEEDEEESGKIVADYKRNARSSHNRGGNRRRDDHHKGGRFHPYKRDDHRSNRGGGGNRDRRSGGRGGGGSNYGRQHGGSHDRRSGGGNKGYQNYNRGGGNRSGGGGNRTGGGNFQKNFNQYQQPQQIQQQRYAGYAATPQYSFPQQPVYPGYQNPYQQPRAAYPAATYQQQQQQQAYYYQQQAQQNYYQQAGYGQQAAYGQYPRRY